MTQNTIDTILQDPELIAKLDSIESSEVSSHNAYASRQSAVEFCRMMWTLAQQEGTNHYKEMRLLYDILTGGDIQNILITPDFDINKLDLNNILSDPEMRELAAETLSLANSFELEEKLTDPESLKNPSFRQMLFEFFDIPPSEDTKINVIDLGCGNGDKARMIIGNLPFQFINYFPIDISPYMSTIALHNLQTILNQDAVPVSIMNALNIKQSDIERLVIESREEKVNRFMSVINKYISIRKDCLSIIKHPELNNFIEYCKTRHKYLTETYQSNNPANTAIPSEEDAEDLCYLTQFSMSRLFSCVFDGQIEKIFAGLNKQKQHILDIIDSDKNNDFVKLERYLDIFAPLIDYYVIYFAELKNLFDQKDFNAIIKTSPYSHSSVFNCTFLNLFEEDNSFYHVNWFSSTKYIERFNKILIARGFVQSQKQPEYLLFGAKSLEKLLDNCIGTSFYNNINLWDKDKVCFIPNKGVYLDFFDFDKVYKSITYLASVNPGKNLFLLLGQTLGNFSKDERKLLISNIYANLNHDDFFLVGVDLCPDHVLSAEARQFRIDRMKSEYSQGEGFARTCLRSDQTDLKYLVEFDETNNDVVIDFEDKSGNRKHFFRSHKFFYQEIQDLLANAGFKLIGGRAYIPQTSIDYGKEYAVILCQKVKNS